MKTAVIALTKNGSLLAAKVKTLLNCDAYIKYGTECKNGQIFKCQLRELIADIYNKYDCFILIMAAGIAFRTFAPYVKSKYEDPAIVVMDEKGTYAISLLSGHIGGANETAELLHEKIGAIPVITTSTDVNKKLAFDMLAKKNNLRIINPKAVQFISSAIVNNERVNLYCDYPINQDLPDYIEKYNNQKTRNLVVISNRVDLALEANHLLYLCPRNLVLGIGCRKNTKAEQIETAFKKFMNNTGYNGLALRAMASIDLKSEEIGIIKLSQNLSLPFLTYSGEILSKYQFPKTGSEFVQQVTGSASVAQAAALEATVKGHTVVEKTIVDGITFSLAEDETIIDL